MGREARWEGGGREERRREGEVGGGEESCDCVITRERLDSLALFVPCFIRLFVETEERGRGEEGRREEGRGKEGR